jgi:hypothetical protein
VPLDDCGCDSDLALALALAVASPTIAFFGQDNWTCPQMSACPNRLLLPKRYTPKMPAFFECFAIGGNVGTNPASHNGIAIASNNMRPFKHFFVPQWTNGHFAFCPIVRFCPWTFADIY